MEYRCIFAGFGGQGVVSMGTLLAYAAMLAGQHTTFFPAYGVAMRGGWANCTVIVSDQPVASPVVYDPDVLVVMNGVALDFFLSWLRPGGLLFVNSSLTDKTAGRPDIRAVYVPATQLAIEGGDSRMANMAMLGAVMKTTGMLPLGIVTEAIAKISPPKIRHLIGKNTRALETGYAAV